MKTSIKSIFLGLSILGIGTVIYNSQLFFNDNDLVAFAQQIRGVSYSNYDMSQTQQPGEYAGGSIASIQNDKNGNPTWIISGLWKGVLTNIDKEKSSQAIDGQSNKSNLPNAVFDARLDMVMLNGSSLHEHAIYNFTLTKISMTKDKNYDFNGTATVTMKDISIDDVPIIIKAMNNNVIGIWVDPVKINNHFGNTPIYGIIVQDVLVKK